MQRVLLLAALAAFAVIGCGDDASSATDAGSDAGDTGTGDPIPLTAVDLLIAVDDTMGMPEEQQILGRSLFAFVDSLMHPPESSSYAAIDDIRIAAVTSNMGFSSDGVNNDGAWPGTIIEACQGFGDDGVFRGIEADTVEMPDGGISDCPALPGTWTQTTANAANAELPIQAACLAKQGTDGCAREQQLASPARALTRDDQAGFVRDEAVLALVIVSDEDDCSMQDGQAMFAEDEVQHQDEKKVDLLCGNHPEHLFPPSHFHETFTDARGRADAVMYVAIAGVPWEDGDPTGAAACQGYGDQIIDCLDQDAMQLVAEQDLDEEPPNPTWEFRPACERYLDPEDHEPVTKGFPGRRFVEIANMFGANGYVYSICNEDWTPAFDALGAMIRGKLAP